MAKSLTASFDSLPLILRLICAIPVLDGIVYGVYRILKGHLIAGLIWIIFGFLPGAILDIIDILMNGKVTYFAK